MQKITPQHLEDQTALKEGMLRVRNKFTVKYETRWFFFSSLVFLFKEKILAYDWTLWRYFFPLSLFSFFVSLKFTLSAPSPWKNNSVPKSHARPSNVSWFPFLSFFVSIDISITFRFLELWWGKKCDIKWSWLPQGIFLEISICTNSNILSFPCFILSRKKYFSDFLFWFLLSGVFEWVSYLLLETLHKKARILVSRRWRLNQLVSFQIQSDNLQP